MHSLLLEIQRDNGFSNIGAVKQYTYHLFNKIFKKAVYSISTHWIGQMILIQLQHLQEKIEEKDKLHFRTKSFSSSLGQIFAGSIASLLFEDPNK